MNDHDPTEYLWQHWPQAWYPVARVSGFAPGKDVVKVEEKLIKVVPAEFKVDVHHWLILHGRYTCVARKPRCGACMIEDLCEYKNKTEY